MTSLPSSVVDVPTPVLESALVTSVIPLQATEADLSQEKSEINSGVSSIYQLMKYILVF